MKYTIKKGDTLSAIAKRHLGDASRWPEIWHNNHAAFKSIDPDKIYPGTVIDLPDPRQEALDGESDGRSLLERFLAWLLRR